VPDPQDADDLVGDLISNLIVTDDQPANFVRPQMFQRAAKPGKLDQLSSALIQSPKHSLGGARAHWFEEIMQSD